MLQQGVDNAIIITDYQMIQSANINHLSFGAVMDALKSCAIPLGPETNVEEAEICEIAERLKESIETKAVEGLWTTGLASSRSSSNLIGDESLDDMYNMYVAHAGRSGDISIAQAGGAGDSSYAQVGGAGDGDSSHAQVGGAGDSSYARVGRTGDVICQTNFVTNVTKSISSELRDSSGSFTTFEDSLERDNKRISGTKETTCVDQSPGSGPCYEGAVSGEDDTSEPALEKFDHHFDLPSEREGSVSFSRRFSSTPVPKKPHLLSVQREAVVRLPTVQQSPIVRVHGGADETCMLQVQTVAPLSLDKLLNKVPVKKNSTSNIELSRVNISDRPVCPASDLDKPVSLASYPDWSRFVPLAEVSTHSLDVSVTPPSNIAIIKDNDPDVHIKPADNTFLLPTIDEFKTSSMMRKIDVTIAMGPMTVFGGKNHDVAGCGETSRDHGSDNQRHVRGLEQEHLEETLVTQPPGEFNKIEKSYDAKRSATCATTLAPSRSLDACKPTFGDAGKRTLKLPEGGARSKVGLGGGVVIVNRERKMTGPREGSSSRENLVGAGGGGGGARRSTVSSVKHNMNPPLVTKPSGNHGSLFFKMFYLCYVFCPFSSYGKRPRG